METFSDAVCSDASQQPESSTQDLDPCPSIPVTLQEFEKWCAPWKNSLIVNVLGKKVNFRMLEYKLQREWAKSGSIRIVDMPEDFYLVQFTAAEDYQHALFEGPWMIMDHYIVVQRWRPFFLVTSAKVQKIAVWIHIPNLPIQLFKDKFLWRVGSKLGNMLKIDKLTSVQSRGRFARICVEIHLGRKLVSQINVLGHILKLEYEGLHSICFECGRYGHKKSQCTNVVLPSCNVMVMAQNDTNSSSMEVETGNKGVVDVNPKSFDKDEAPANQILPNSLDLYGPWMLVRKGNKRIGKVVDKKVEQALVAYHNSAKPVMTGSSHGDNSWFLTFIYASPHSQFRVELWRKLRNLSSGMTDYWCLLGDFNVVLRDHERQGGSNTAYLEKLQLDLWSEYENILVCEELLWFQKSRCKWLCLGDRNTKYFHGTTVIRRQRNKVKMLQDESGRWISDKAELEGLVTNFYKDLFQNIDPYTPFNLTGYFPEVHDSLMQNLGRDIIEDEIFGAIRRMGSFKAPGPDGFQPIFYQTRWSTVGPSICSLIHEFEAHPSKIATINDTFITLIPKSDNVSSLKHMRPIGLCNVSYKILTKVLSHWLRSIMKDLVGPNQCSFVLDRHSSDNIIITQEVVHSMRNKKGKVGWMAIKIDLEKAYDRLKWCFVKDTLQDIGLPASFINLIWACISTPKFRMLWNGEVLEEFSPSRGIRQGDPISLYLFVLCMERLFHLIEVAVEHALWNPI
uniref:Retrovirus-related Pol polyprotein LINE-1 n=1 Tax=Cajanus cajan TaxID=3821 RepID=A0A151TWI8_CAJCA|nr:Retrovirus-related Pol polyprotein LINE-1 [Cajanus cajan]